MKETFLEKAELHIQKQQYKEALDTLFHVWRAEKTADVAWRILACMRLQYHFKSAINWLEKVEPLFPKDTRLKEEKVALEFEMNIRPVLTEGTLEDILRESDSIFDQLKDDELRKKIVFTVVRKAKEEKKWDIAEHWLSRIPKKLLTKKQREVNNKKRISERQRYYLNKVDIYTALEKYTELKEILHEAIEDFPELKSFQKLLTDARFQMGDYDTIISEMDAAIDWNHPNWILVENAAKAHFLKGNTDEAWHLACLAFNSRGQQKVKVELHLLMAEIAEKRETTEMANDFRTLSILVRSQNKIALTDELREHLNHILNPDLTIDAILLKYEDDIIDGINIHKPRKEGKIVWYPDDRNFAKIDYLDEDKNIIIFKDDLNLDCKYEGAQITFVEDENIDRKSGEKRLVARFGRRKVKLNLINS